MTDMENEFQDYTTSEDTAAASEPFETPATEEFAENVMQEDTPMPKEEPSSYESTANRRTSPYENSPYESAPYTQAPHRNPQPKPQYQEGFQMKKRKGSSKFLPRAIAAVLAVSLVGGSCLITAASINSKWEKKNAQTVSQMNEKIDALQKQIDEATKAAQKDAVSGSTVAKIDGMTPSQVYAQNVNSVVGISSTIRSTSFYGQTTEGTATGSGFILTEDGYVVTNYHVVEGASATSVITNGGEEYPAKVVGSDSVNDVAVLKIETENLPAVKLGSSEDLIIGDMVVAIGNPLGQLTATQTVGYVSGKNREVNTDNSIISMIQTDAAINSGNSGGPLFNMNGEVVGITTAKYSGTTNSGASIEGIGFAIPIDDVMNIIGDLRDFGYVTGAYLGVTVQNTDAESAALYGLPTGAYVVSVVEGGSADRAGVHPKDIIIDLGGHEVSNVTQLTRALRHFKANDQTTITVIRAGQTLTLDITLDEKPKDLNAPVPQESVPQEGSFDEWYDYFRKYFGEG